MVLTLVILVVTKLCVTGGWSKEWIALTVSCVQLDLVDSPGADTEDQETRSGAG